jgi:catechol 2,3-dioxygenase-like lactoylglutathione lyase family enzyme
MCENVEDIIRELAPAQRKRVETRAAVLIAEEMTIASREVRDCLAAPNAIGHHCPMANPFSLSEHNPIAFVATRDPARAREFYEQTLGLRLVSDERPFALVFDLHGIMLRVTPVRELTTAPYTVLGWEVPDIAEAAQALQTGGVVFQRYRGLEQDELGVWTSPSGAKVAWFKDPDGNTLSISQH